MMAGHTLESNRRVCLVDDVAGGGLLIAYLVPLAILIL